MSCITTELCSLRDPLDPLPIPTSSLWDSYGTLAPVDLPAMEKVFEQLCRDPEEKVGGTHWSSLITNYGIYGNNVGKALEIFDSIPTHPSNNSEYPVLVGPVIWEAILNVLANKGSIEDLENMRQRMMASESQQTAYVNNVLILGYARAGRIDDARAVFASMGDSVTGVAAPNNHPTLHTSSGHIKPSTVTDETTHVVYREPSTYEAMIRAEMKAGTREAAEAVCAKMEERRYPVAVYLRARSILDEPVRAHFCRYEKSLMGSRSWERLICPDRLSARSSPYHLIILGRHLSTRSIYIPKPKLKPRNMGKHHSVFGYYVANENNAWDHLRVATLASGFNLFCQFSSVSMTST